MTATAQTDLTTTTDMQYVLSCVAEGAGRAFTDGRDRDLLGSKAQQIFDFVREFRKSNSSVPSIDLVRERFGLNLESFQSSGGEIPSLREQLRLRFEQKTISDSLQTAIKRVQNREIDSAVELLQTACSQVTSSKQRLIHTWTKDYEERLALYRQTGLFFSGEFGIRSGWESLDATTLGWQPGELSVIVAEVSVGKTWFLSIVAQRSREQGKRVLFVSMEMPRAVIGRRIDAIEYRLPYEGLRQGRLGEDVRESYEERLVSNSSQQEDRSDEIYIVDAATVERVADIESLVEEIEPDIVLVDSFYKLREGGRAMWERITEAIGSLSLLKTRTNLPVVVTSQFAKMTRAEKKKMPSLDQLAGSMDISRDADIVLGLKRTPFMADNGQLLIVGMKTRESRTVNIKVQWDLDMMSFEELEVLEEDSNEVMMAGDVEY